VELKKRGKRVCLPRLTPLRVKASGALKGPYIFDTLGVSKLCGPFDMFRLMLCLHSADKLHKCI